MNANEIGRAYDQIAELWSGEEFPRTNGIEAHERAISFVGEKRFALDIGCGSSGRLLDLMIAHGFDVAGIDVSRRMVELARQRHPAVVIHHADICEWKFPRRYDLISAWDSIWHVPLKDQETVIGRILDSLAPQGVCIFTIGGVDAAGEMVDSYMGSDMYYSSIGLRGTLEVVLAAGCVCRHVEYDSYPECHVYLIVQRDQVPSTWKGYTGGAA